MPDHAAVYAVQLKDILCQVDPNADKLHDGLLLSKPVVWKRQFDTNVSSGGGGVHPIASGRKPPAKMSLRPHSARAGDAHHDQLVANYVAFFSRKTTL